MSGTARRWALVLVVACLALALATSPAIAHEGHDGHGNEQDDGLSIWPFFVVVGTISAGGSLLASGRLGVPREFAVGLAAGGIAIALGAAIVWLA